MRNILNFERDSMNNDSLITTQHYSTTGIQINNAPLPGMIIGIITSIVALAVCGVGILIVLIYYSQRKGFLRRFRSSHSKSSRSKRSTRLRSSGSKSKLREGDERILVPILKQTNNQQVESPTTPNNFKRSSLDKSHPSVKLEENVELSDLKEVVVQSSNFQPIIQQKSSSSEKTPSFEKVNLEKGLITPFDLDITTSFDILLNGGSGESGSGGGHYRDDIVSHYRDDVIDVVSQFEESMSNNSNGSNGSNRSAKGRSNPSSLDDLDHESILERVSSAPVSILNMRESREHALANPSSMHSQSPSREKRRKYSGNRGISWDIDYNEIEKCEIIGHGAFGVVYRGKWRGQEIALKEMKKELVSPDDIEQFKMEAAIMQIRASPNILTFYGMCSNPISIVTEYMPNGSLEILLKRLKLAGKKLTNSELLKIVCDIAKGMLHLQNENIIHRDLATRNLLLDKSFNVKIADFGLSRVNISNSANYTATKGGPLKHMAPESIIHRKYSVKSDVWSFGITLIEIVTMDEPYPGRDGLQVAVGVVNNTTIPEIPEDTPPFLVPIIKSCLLYHDKDRMDFVQICKALKIV